MDLNQIEIYLKRLHLRKEPPSLEYLDKLQEHHLLYIPFENLDVMNKKHIQLTTKNLYEKILINNRGGFCFELNGLFCDLLDSLGFQVYMVEAAVYSKKLGTFGYMRTHMALIVTINTETYLVDVGFGDSFRKPLSLRGKEIEDISGKYRLTYFKAAHFRLHIKESLHENFEYLILEQNINGEWDSQYKFHLYRKLLLSDYQDECNWIQSSPESGFTKGRTWSIAKLDGRISLSENGITITKNLVKNKIEYTEKLNFDYYLDYYTKELAIFP